MLLAVMDAVNYMLNHGFYSDEKELIGIATPVVKVLNGTNDMYEKGNPKPIGIKRYFPSQENDLITKIKSRACDILL